MGFVYTQKSVNAVNRIIEQLAEDGFTVDEACGLLSFASAKIKETSTVKKSILPTDGLPKD